MHDKTMEKDNPTSQPKTNDYFRAAKRPRMGKEPRKDEQKQPSLPQILSGLRLHLVPGGSQMSYKRVEILQKKSVEFGAVLVEVR